MSIKEVSAKIRKISTTVVVANGFRFAVFVVTTLLVFSLAARVCQARKGPSERQIKKAVNQLDLTPREKENLILSIYTGAQDGLLDFSSEIGTKTLLKVLNSQGSGPQKKAQFIRKYQQAIEE
ncbi:hypothetical protein KGY79_12550, partial [Candidatus Bipolaricaulota bacterium]|nr:hypothetical protein [Candidatus Bipolaricaulota bacterium]